MLNSKTKHMHDSKVINQFIELRVQGLPISKISEKIGVPAPTLYHWNETARPRIHKLRLLKLEQAEDRLLGPQHLQFEALARCLKAVETQTLSKIDKGGVENLSLPELVRLGSSIRKQLYRLKFHVRHPLVEHAKSLFADPSQPLILSSNIRLDGSLINPEPSPDEAAMAETSTIPRPSLSSSKPDGDTGCMLTHDGDQTQP